jgi:hypothetical protein
MSKYNFSDLFESKFDNDPEKVLERYKYNKIDDIEMRIDKCNGDNANELKDIVNEIVLWKVNRMVSINDKTLQGLYELRKIKTVSEAICSNDARAILRSLICSKGVRLAMASTFMNFFNPDIFPIFDQRAYRVIYEKDYIEKAYSKNNIDEHVNIYFDYLQKCFLYHKEVLEERIPFSKIDKFLYQLDKEMKNKIKNY